MNPADITPMLLAWNEEANLPRCLSALRWADRVVVVDSGSDDRTAEICAGFPNVERLERPFDSFATQANFALDQVRTEWVLSLDADYIVPEDFANRAASLEESAVAGFSLPFTYCVFGRPLRGTLYPRRVMLYRRALARYRDDGHTQRVTVSGRVDTLDWQVRHDDRKPIARWFASQSRYAREEAEKLMNARALSLPDRLRKALAIAPVLVPLHCLFVKGCILDGWRGCYYALQRTCAEIMLAIVLLDRKLRRFSE